MKRCPQCEFIYENEQSLCDMDGCELVYQQTGLLVSVDVRPRDLPEKLQLKPGLRSRWRRYALLSICGVALGTSLFFVDNALTHRASSPPRNAAAGSNDARPSNVASPPDNERPPDVAPPRVEVAAITTPAPNPSPASNDEAESAPSAATTRPTTNRARANGRAATVARPAPTPAQLTTPKREEKKLKTDGENAKKQSKLGSILKKTGRVLKKPFGF